MNFYNYLKFAALRAHTVILIIIFCSQCQQKPIETSVSNISIQIQPLDYSYQHLFEELQLNEYTYSNYALLFSPRGGRLGGKTTGIPNNITNKTDRLGTHLHVNLNNTAHQRSNRNKLDIKINDGPHKLFAFVCGADYVSIKAKDAQLCKDITVRAGQLIKSKDLENKHLIYNAPLGNFEHHDSLQIVLDFVLFNTHIAPDSNYVSLTINEQFVAKIDNWQAHVLKGFEVGSYTIELALFDRKDKLLAPPVSETIHIKKSADK